METTKQKVLNDSLLMAVKRGDVDGIRLHLSEGAQVDAVDDKNAKPLHYAICNRDIEVVDILLDANAYMDYLFNDRTILMESIYTKSEGIVRLLLERGANPNAKNERDESALDFLINQRPECYTDDEDDKFIRMAEMILTWGADCNLSKICSHIMSSKIARIDKTYERLLMLSMDHCKADNLDPEDVKRLFEYGTEKIVRTLVDSLTDSQKLKCTGYRNAIIAAARNEDVKVLKILGSVGLLDASCIDRWFLKVLQFPCNLLTGAVNNTRLENFKFLMKLYGDMLEEEDVMFLAYIAIRREDIDITRILFEYEPDLEVKNLYSEYSILQASVGNKNQRVKEYVLKYVAKLEMLGKPLSAESLNIIKEDTDAITYYNDSLVEIERMKSFYVFGSVTIFELFMSDNIGPYARNDEFVEKFESKCTCDEFPIYHDSLKDIFDAEVDRQNVLKSAAAGLSLIFKCNQYQFPTIFDSIIRYLSESDLDKLITI